MLAMPSKKSYTRRRTDVCFIYFLFVLFYLFIWGGGGV